MLNTDKIRGDVDVKVNYTPFTIRQPIFIEGFKSCAIDKVSYFVNGENAKFA